MAESDQLNKGKNIGDLVSYHVFLLPFKWKRSTATDVPEEAEFAKIVAAVTGAVFDKTERDPRLEPDQSWKDQQSGLLKKWQGDHKFDVDTILNYNEYFYFYDYVREILYEGPEKAHDANFPAIKHFRFNKLPGASYEITTTDPRNEDETVTYVLAVDDILLHLYYTGVGVLSFHLINQGKGEKPQDGVVDVRYINQFGRRLYPPYFEVAVDLIGQPALFSQHDFADRVPAGKELAERIDLTGIEQKTISENWHGYLQERRKADRSFKLTPLLRPFLAEIDTEYHIEPILDDRMFVLCWYGNDSFSKDLYAPETDSPDQFLYNEDWYKLVFIDGGLLTVQHPGYQAELIQRATNYRWARYGTFFGITDYSFVMLTGKLDSLKKNNAAFLVTHAMTMYYKLVELALVQRASVQRFSDEITRIAYLTGKNDHEFAAAAEALYRKYIRFVNRIYFREVTPQVQGIELYDKLHEQSRLREQVESLKQEIHELHNFVLQQAERKRNERLNNLNILVAAFAPPALLLAWYALGDFLPESLAEAPYLFYLALLAAVLSAAGSLLAYWLAKSWRGYLYAGGLFIILLLLPFFWTPSNATERSPNLNSEVETRESQSKNPETPEVIAPPSEADTINQNNRTNDD